MGGGIISPQERDARRMQGLLGGLHDQNSYNRAMQQQAVSPAGMRMREEHRRMEEMRLMYPVERDRRLAEEAMRNPRNEGMMIQPIVDDMKRDIDKVDIRTYLQAKTDDWLRGVEL